ncbi:MAG: efflux RND transporter permease subunit [Gammaproteobacteria bacterium]|nr:efflux RND transporter permease subunit [Gammaproteobacteria bacterium]NIR85726.1 efflux RND transporter permease subunit [Gammaproteobacteria bacterium]NIR90259.1 efflux RND transporter permease subunit [Gammaproteobacteria bacterium]NIU06860.1 efflux RND transporter permease subunit [Gammaproteobacteria bacterium]NIV53793.1 AcrB/AcrD/AcrF family protein [Gammaproteobacteria bacterium]
MNIAELAIRNRTTTLVLTAVLFVGGIVSFQGLSRLEDPEFTIKEALVFTPYPGATAAEVEEEVSDTIEQAVQQLGQLKEVESKSDRGLSTVTVRIKDQYDKSGLPQVWDELRRKVNDVQNQLPPGAGPSIVNDDYGDVWGVFFALYGDEYTYAELKEVAKLLRRELLLVQDVAKVEFWGERTEAVYVEPDRDRMSQLGIHPAVLIDELRQKNLVADAGRVQVGPEFIALSPTGTFQSVADFEDMLISGASSGGEGQIYLRDIATVRRGYVEPPTQALRYDGHRAIGMGISTVSGGNVVTMGEAIEKRMRELLPRIPLGIQFGIISLQSEAVTQAIDGFLISLLEAVAIVIVVLLVFMGLKSGLIIGFVLALTILGTFIFMGPWDVALERISLGALIIALGMLVDNAIVVVDGMLVRIQKGQDSVEAAKEVVEQTALPLLGATAVAIMAFGAIGLSDDSTGEFCRSLFKVVLISLSLSWVTAVTVTPLLGVMFLKPPKQPAQGGTSEAGADPYGGFLYRAYRGLLLTCLRFRWLTVLVVLGIFGASLWGFQLVDKSFFPDSTRPQFMVDFWLPQGTHIDDTVQTVDPIEAYLRELEGATHVTSLVGAGGMRFLVTYAPEKQNSAYVQFLVDVDDYRKIDDLVAEVEDHLIASYPGVEVYGKKFLLGPGSGGKIQIRFSGPNRAVLRKLANETQAILHADGGAKAIRTDWREQVKVVRPVVAEAEANNAGVSTPDVALAVKTGFEGERVGVYREGDELLPIVYRAPERERADVANLHNLQIWSPAAQQFIPLRQVVSDFETAFENEIIQRLNRKSTITVHADPVSGPASTLLGRIRPKVEALEMGPDYELEWWGEYRDSRRAQAGIAASIPFFFLAMVLIVIALFNSLRKPAVIWLTVPLALIGVTGGLLATDQPFGFMALLGFMSLSGMLVKNAIVLIDEMTMQENLGSSTFKAVVDSGVSRLRPVAMAALTTALGMIPLLLDAFFVSMAVTIIAGLVVATVLTMIVVPVFYVIFYRAPYEANV